MEYLKVLIMLAVMFVVAFVATKIEERQGSIYHCTFWEEVRMNFAVLALGGCLVLLLLSKQ